VAVTVAQGGIRNDRRGNCAREHPIAPNHESNQTAHWAVHRKCPVRYSSDRGSRGLATLHRTKELLQPVIDHGLAHLLAFLMASLQLLNFPLELLDFATVVFLF